MDISQIRKLIRLLQASDVTEIEVTEGDQTVRISRREHIVTVPQVQATVAAPVAAPQQTTPVETPPAPAEESGEHIVKSPMVGTFYRAPSPEADSFVSEGTRVKKGDILCIIEAMKLMNEIEAEYDGVVEEILVENASPLEYGQPMFVIAPLA
ncbi:MAG: acetyl-CoA carboxylase biotin carboxyl carrier protein [Zetaproteobacteria bacterium]|nr:MAG: acetyl-CoA carboxylase biotin carboxyl carrier protein [Zetaproteobacteria bacterium]